MGRQAAAKRARKASRAEAPPAPRLDTPADVEAYLASVPPELLAEVIAELPVDMQETLAADAAKVSFAEFIRQAWQYVPQVELALVWSWHMDAYALHAEAVARGEIETLNINVPPGFNKSVVWSVLFPCWVWTWWPRAQFLCGSYAKELAVRDSTRRRAVIESDWYQATFARPAGWRLARDMNRQDWFRNTAGGEMFSTGVGGAGRRAHFIIIDDALDIEDAYSATKRAEAVRWISQTLSQRFIAGSGKRLINIQQRLHEEDPSADLIKKGAENLCLPMEFEPHRRAVTYRVVDGKRRKLWQDPREAEGELLFPALVPREEVEKKKTDLGPFGYASQMQQRPSPEGGGVFALDKWRFWTMPDADAERIGVQLGVVARPRGCASPVDAPARTLELGKVQELLISVDATFKETGTSWVAIQVWGRLGARRPLLHRIRRKMSFTDTVEAIKGVIKLFPRARRKLIEGKANGDAICNTLEVAHGVTGIEPVNPGTAGKLQRAHAMVPYQAAGNVELPEGAPWVPEFLAETTAFPNGTSDDEVDCMSQGLQGFEAERSTAQKWAAGAF